MRSKKAKSSKAEVDKLRAVVEEMTQKAATTDALEQRLQVLEVKSQEERTRFNTSLDMITLHMGKINERSARVALAWRERASDLESHVEELEEELEEKEALVEKVEELEEKYRKVESKLRRAERELEAVQGFLGTSDQYSGAEISDAVERLNDSIYQCASMLANEAVEGAPSAASPSDAASEPPQSLREQAYQAIVGQEWDAQIVEKMVSEIQGENMSLLRCMIQHIISSWCHYNFEAFFPENPDAEDSIKAVWCGIRENYDFRIARNWLAMIHAQLHPTKIDRSEMLTHIFLVMTVGGWQGEPSTLDGTIAGRVDRILEEVLKIKKMVSEGVLSAAFEVLYPQKQTPFNSDEMTIIEGVGTKEQHRKNHKAEGPAIAFSVGFGVEYWSPKPPCSRVITKAKVVLL